MPDFGAPFAAARDGVNVMVRLTPGAGRNRVDGLAREADGAVWLKAAVTAAAEGGKANAALAKLLAKEWRVPKTSVRVVRGATSRRKTLHIAGDPAALSARLARWMKSHDG
ncbi:MAG: DUF167 family protein [Kiloniellaceae bacterium]